MIKYFTRAARAQRARNRERFHLTLELRMLGRLRVYGYPGECSITDRLAELDRLDLDAVTIKRVML